MKKIFSLITLVAFSLVMCPSLCEAQTFTRLKSGGVSDTIHKSSTLFTSSVNLNVNDLQAMSLEVAMDSVSGTPDTKFVLQRSVDGTHWSSVAGDTLAPVYTGNGNTTHPSVSKTLNVNPYYGAFMRVKYYTGSGTQKSKVWITVRSATIR